MTVKRRSTHIQQDIKDIISNSPNALSHSDVEARLSVPADRATVFRVLNRLVEDGYIHKIMSDDGVSFFAMCQNGCSKEHHHDEHSHFRCVQCNKFSCLNDNLTPSLPAQYQIIHTNNLITGICPSCR